MTRWIAVTVVVLGVFLCSSVALAADCFVLVLRDGKRLEVRSEYRIVNEVAVFTTADGRRISIALANIDIAATERVNGQRDGEFRAKAAPPRVIGAEERAAAPVASAVPTPQKSSPAPARKAGRILTNADFGGGLRQVSTRPMSGVLVASPAEKTAESVASVPASANNNDEAYWRGRARAILMEVYTQQEIIRSLNSQAQTLQRKIEAQGTTFLLGWDASGNRVLLPQEVLTAEKQELMQVRERIRDAQARLTGLYVQYTVLQEEARRAGVPPGWLR
ncbi:MAG: hypothetical protein NZ585_13135 [Chloracidobacterium sp.]|nr:hypothetical protein [Chloracidobacterium sp.]MDW8218508.1 hypothetical protein [Acidobacteriota bacterium]